MRAEYLATGDRVRLTESARARWQAKYERDPGIWVAVSGVGMLLGPIFGSADFEWDVRWDGGLHYAFLREDLERAL